MKWRDGTWVVCPFCSAPRSGGSSIKEYEYENKMEKKRKLPARRHEYRCGTVLAESIPLNGKNNCHGYIAVLKICPATLVTISKALTFVASEYDLMTISNYDACELMAEQLGNVTAKAIYLSLRNTYAMQDNFRLPPIPTLASHIRDVAKIKVKE